MAGAALVEQAKQESWSDEDVVSRILAGETALYELLMRRYNQRLYRVARAILHNGGEAEDVMQDTYVRAYEHLNQFAGKAKFSTWLTRIAVHEALARQQRGSRYRELEPTSEKQGDAMDTIASPAPDPEREAANSEIRTLLEEAIEDLPGTYRTIFMLREVEELSTTDVADILAITEENVKIRLHRARVLLRKNLYSRTGMKKNDAFTFHASRCDRVVKHVFEQFKSGTKTESIAAKAYE